jgi:hypothetical protein
MALARPYDLRHSFVSLLIRLQVADPPTDLLILRIAGGVPKSSCYGIVKGDQRRYAADATLAQVVLASLRQRESDAFSPMPIADGESIQVPSPPVPGGDQGADDLPVSLGYEESGRGFIDQSLDVIKTIRCTCMLAAGLCPQVQYRWQVGPSAAAYGDFLAGQVRSITSRFVFPGISAVLPLSRAMHFTRAPLPAATIGSMAGSPTRRVEFDSELLDRLHERRPAMSDRELLESMARMSLGRETLRSVQERYALSEDEAIGLGRPLDVVERSIE